MVLCEIYNTDFTDLGQIDTDYDFRVMTIVAEVVIITVLHRLGIQRHG